ncbi:MAG: CYTH domain-containing protein [Oscillospiraceae bacterium]|nr:CYTH domain-containing protein [Oscillospiraceae bacterium]
MANEIERKFLVDKWDFPGYLIGTAEKLELVQAYLQFPTPEIPTEKRIRKSNDSYFYTEKTKSKGSLLSRQEEEREITKEEFENLMLQQKGSVIQKLRYKIPYQYDGASCIELDVYKGYLGGLIVAEVEFPDIESGKGFNPPMWFGKEVTEDKAYKNASLAQKGLPAVKREIYGAR